jgi:Spy/CpxP family protein refolding chaperone
LDELDKVYREQARKYLILWKQKLQELYGTNLPSYDHERILKLAKEVGDAYSKFEMIQAKRLLALLETLTKEQKEKLKALIKRTVSHTDAAQQSEFNDGGESCGCSSCCN